MGRPVDSTSIEIGKRLVEIGFENGIERFNAFAGDDGELVVSFYYGDRIIDLTLEIDKTFTFEEDFNDEQIEFIKDLDYSSVYGKLCEFAQNMLESCTQKTTTVNADDLRVYPSNRQPQMPAYRFLIRDAVLPQAVPYASISRTSTIRSQVTPPYSG